MERYRGRILFAAVAALALITCCGAAFSQDIPGEFLQRSRTFVTDFGAIPDDGKDDSTAIKACIVAAIANGTYHVHFPAGTWDISTNNVLHPVTAGTVTNAGISFTGDAQNYSILKLANDGATTLWLYDSGANAASVVPGWNRCQFENLWFKGAGGTAVTSANAYTNGFRICATTASGGVDKGFIFRNCRHDYLGAPLSFTGSANTDSFNAYSCWWNQCGPVLINNDQALLLNWYSCHFWAADDVFWMKATGGSNSKGGGGAINLHDCDIVQGNASGDTTAHYTVRIDDGAEFYRVWLFDSCRWELRNPESRLVYWAGTASTITNSHIAFRDCDLSVWQQSQAGIGGAGADTNGQRQVIVLGPGKRIVFERTYLADQLAILFQDVNTASVVGFAYQPIVEFNGCGLPAKFISGTNDAGTSADTNRGLSGRVTLSNSYGRVIARNCFIRDSGPAEKFAVDFDYGARVGGRGEPQVQAKRAEFKASPQAWPTASAGVRSVLLPENAVVTDIRFNEPAQGTSSTTKQVLVGYQAQTITGAASDGGTEVRITINSHGLANGDKVFISGVTGTTEANGYFVAKDVATNTFDLTGSTFANAYVSGGTAYKILAESTSGRSDAQHIANITRETASTPLPIDVSTTLINRRWYLLATAGTLSKSGGYAYLVYE